MGGGEGKGDVLMQSEQLLKKTCSNTKQTSL